MERVEGSSPGVRRGDNGEFVVNGCRVSVWVDEKVCGGGWHSSVNVSNTTKLST